MNRKPVFDTVRRQLGRGFTPAEVKELDAAIDRALDPRDGKPGTLQPATGTGTALASGGLATSEAGIALIHQFEGFARRRADGRVEAYPDPATGGEPWTIGWGSTGADPFNGGRIRRGTIWTQAQAEDRFRQQLAEKERELNQLLRGGAATTQNQFDGMIALVFNIGSNRFSSSTLLRLHRAGNYSGAAAEFARWNRAAGRVMAGLTRRREAEARLYRGAA